MRKHIIQFCLCVSVVAALLGVSAGAGLGSASIWNCAKRDLQILLLVDERNDRTGISAQAIADTMFAIVSARMACFEGRVRDSLALYDDIGHRIMLEPNRSGRARFDPPADVGLGQP